MTIGKDRRLAEEDVPEPSVGDGEVRLDVSYCGICGSDIHLRPSEMVPVGTVMGHEFSGRVAEVGPGVGGWDEGERVCAVPFEPCGRCAACRAGDENVCENAATSGVGLGGRPGAYAEQIAVSASTLLRLPDELSDQAGALVEPLAVGVHGLRIARAEPDEPVVVLGAGPIGAMSAVALRARGFERIVVVEPGEGRSRLLTDLGFRVVGLDDAQGEVLDALAGQAPSVVLECAGNPKALQLGLELVGVRGRVVALGVLEEPAEISPLMLLLKEAEIRGSFAYRREDFAEALEMLADGRAPAERLITAVEPLERAQDMFDELARSGTDQLKVLLEP